MASGTGTPDDPWVLATPSGGSEYTMYVDPDTDPSLLVCQVGKTKLTYLARALARESAPEFGDSRPADGGAG